MDQTRIQHTQICQIHSKKKIKYLQVKEIANDANKSVLLCNECFNEDLDSKAKDIIKISQIIEDGETQIISKWPPLEDQEITKKLKQQMESLESSNSILKKINDYFTVLKNEVMNEIDMCQKKMINQAIELPFIKDQLLKQYQQISQISKLRQLILQGQESSFEEHQSSYLDISNISNVNSSSSSDKLMQLISNKSNFCSEQFLKQVKDILDKVNPVLDKIEFENMHSQNYKPIQFSKINLDQIFSSSEKFDLLNQLQEADVEELINLLKKRIQFQDKKIYETSQTYKQSTNYQESNKRLSINKNSSKKIKIKVDQPNYFGLYKDWDINCVSQNILEKQKKYIFRIKCDVIQPEVLFNIGLIQNESIDKIQGFKDKLSCRFMSLQNKIKYQGGCGIDKITKGFDFEIDKNSVFELRVWIEGQQLEILDYPDYQNKIELIDQNKHYLDSYQDLRIYLYLFDNSVSYQLVEAYTVEQFDF
ncbi:hypothetical protein TTHERM_00930860 (macronuclear) [Tetrahymena thermophila SB210]|uniref:Zinc carboxypeptidase family protein n=1 Tax=Tetrahymena thermophila (strain SB210) TaxID=312017 RepID=Q24CF5_TETTS|nr:hypothetical protein TTHERM_00930860 [Tetrahymena thermophila SB210]EAS05505.2 hypothetical protein TTHERM_00930860 [Tetrahymena thermophila SB210]|eukprot:XP_001025750.2 hypothetical protein TTHERM_00930860 [Tetrahymena thermophila SB210]